MMVEDIEQDIEQQARDEFAYKIRFPEECKKLPMEYLTLEEHQLATKCINQEQMSKEELSKLKQLLANYRPYMKEYDVQQVEKNLEDNVRIIKSSKELLNLLDDPNLYRFDMHYKLNGELLRLQFKIKPLSDGEYSDLLSVQTRIFRNLENEEKVAYAKMLNKMELTPEEANMQQQIQDKIVEILGDVDDTNERVTQFLIDHVEMSADDETLPHEIQVQLWNKIDIGTRNLVYAKCKEILKIDEELETELFPALE